MTSELLSLTDISKNAYNNRQYTTNNQRLNVSGSIDYSGFKRLLLGRYNLLGVNLTLGQWFNYTRETDNTVVTDYDTIVQKRNFNNNLSNSNKREVIEYTPYLSFSKDAFKWSDAWYSVLILTAGQTIQTNTTTSTASGLSSFKNNSNTTKYGIVVNYPADFTLSSTADRISNSNLNKPIVLWNAFATYRIMKQQGELKFSAMDLLKKYQNISNSAGPYGTTTRITNGLQQYFLLTFSYFPRKFGKTEIKKK